MADRRVERVHRLTGQHGAPGFDGGGDHQRNADVQVALERLDGEQPGLEAARVEDRLEQQQVDAAFEERSRLDVVGLPQLLEGHVAAERQRLGRRSERAGHKPRFRRGGEFVGRLSRQPRRRDVQLPGLSFETELGQHDWRALKTVGGDDVGARLEIGAMHRENPFGMGVAQVLVAPFQAGAAVVGGGGMVRLQHGAHGAIEDQDPRGQRIIELLSPETVDQGQVYSTGPASIAEPSVGPDEWQHDRGAERTRDGAAPICYADVFQMRQFPVFSPVAFRCLASRDRQPAREGPRQFGASRQPTCPECGAQRTVNTNEHPNDSSSRRRLRLFLLPGLRPQLGGPALTACRQ